MGIKYQAYDKLSEQEIIECATYNGNLLGCNGGLDTAVYNFSRYANGITTAANDPYVRTTNGRTCNLSRTRVNKSTVLKWNTLPQRNEANMKEVLFNNGPLYVSFYVAKDFYYYSSGIYADSDHLCPSSTTNHGMSLIGYGTEKGTDYWILKNSWGNQ